MVPEPATVRDTLPAFIELANTKLVPEFVSARAKLLPADEFPFTVTVWDDVSEILTEPLAALAAILAILVVKA